MKNNKYLVYLIGIVAVGMIIYWYCKKRKAVQCNCEVNPGCGCNSNSASLGESSSAEDVIVANTRIMFEDPKLMPGDHFSAGYYEDRNLTDITYGMNGFDDNSPTNLSVPLLAKPEVIRIEPMNANGGVIKTYD